MLDCKTQYCSEIVEIAAHALMVDAKDETAAGFYRHHGFIALPDSPLTTALRNSLFCFAGIGNHFRSTQAKMGNGKWEMGNGKWEMGNGRPDPRRAMMHLRDYKT